MELITPCPPQSPMQATVPIVGTGRSLRPGEMEPTAFICKGCSARIQEAKYGAGFERCGAVMADKKYMLCRRCLSIVMELLEAMADQAALAKFCRELIGDFTPSRDRFD